MEAAPDAIAAHSELRLDRPGDATLRIGIAGSWTLAERVHGVEQLEQAIGDGPPLERIRFDAADLAAWDSALLVFLRRAIALCGARGLAIDRDGLPGGVRALLRLAEEVPETQTGRDEGRLPLLARLGERALRGYDGALEGVTFIGEAFLAFLRLLRGRARFRRSDLWLILQHCGAQALPIVSLISFLVGLILAFVGAIQLEQFGAEIYVANLVGIAMARDMGAMMTGIIMAGRTGAAFAAQLGTMTVNEEIDALETMGISPMEFLVLPRMLALMLMLPLLCLYSILLGILGGFVVGVTMLDLGPIEYFNQTVGSVTLTQIGGGVFKSFVYGVIVAISGCLRGMQSGRSASAVGTAATSAVVTGITYIVVASAVLTVLYNVLGI